MMQRLAKPAAAARGWIWPAVVVLEVLAAAALAYGFHRLAVVRRPSGTAVPPPPPPGPFARGWRHVRDLARSRLFLAVEYVGVVVAAYLFTKALGSYSGTALWIPATWRQAVDTAGGLWGGSIYAMTLATLALAQRLIEASPGHATRTPVAAAPHAAGRQPATPSSVAGGAPAVDHGSPKHSTRRLALMWVTTSVSALCVWQGTARLSDFMQLRNTCVVGFDARDWLDEQRDENLKLSREAHRTATDAELAAAGKDAQPDMTPYVPESFNREHNLLYLPEEKPPYLQAEIDRLDRKYNGLGLEHMLHEEPDYVLDFLDTAASTQIAATNRKFLAFDMAIIGWYAMAFACLEFDLKWFLGSVIAIR